MNLNHVTVPVTAIEPAVAFYKLLGLKPIVLNDRYARFELPLAPAAGAQRLYSIGWHLDQPVLWTE